ncbi:MAG: hypothetical protein PVI21_01320 [Candidatus Woesebacteria bacterium]|jgi:hypothetical protein
MARGKGGKGGLGWTFLSSGKKTVKSAGSKSGKFGKSKNHHDSLTGTKGKGGGKKR